ncbi:nibrin [Hyposmocoma kahamanoa]|uniref:nibrin n=1 Tax=Hyposmocoma kahamanoa TaxID=1477025 RepID=UPI000E6D6C1C|nr:nibrin [Hyposmocoma kahamanoa]
MWYLTSDTDHRVIYVMPNKEITIGRSVDALVCNFAIPDDPSISRKHATISVSNNDLFLQDMGSRYGTFINDFTSKVEAGLKIKLNNKDNVKFGKMSSVWKIHEIHFVTCTSTLKGENLQNLKVCLGKLGGLLKNEWDESCAYLTMPAITLTIKVVLALAQGSHIVTTDFWNKCLDAITNQTLLPNPSNYAPQVVESTLNKENVSFLPNDVRKTLFSGKSVIFFSRRQFDMYKPVLVKCSAIPLLLSDTKMTKSALCEPNIIVIQYNITSTSQETQAQRDQINDIINYMKNNGKRIIADAEIGLAILYCSTEKYCNPGFNFPSEVMKQTNDKNGKPANVLAHESQEPTQKLNHKNQNVVINETLPGFKRKLSDDDNFETNSNKKFATESTKADSNNDCAKRKLPDDESNIQPTKRLAVDNEDEDFNFVNNTNQHSSTKKLNFTKPLQKKQDISANDEEDLFNFVQDNAKTARDKTNALFYSKNANKMDQDEEPLLQGPKNKIVDEKIDIVAMRGSKLKELMESNTKLDFDVQKIKKEESDLDGQMKNLDLGEVVLKVRKDLIVKKEPLQVEDQNSQQRNFKKFKKVWPVKMQVTVIPKSSMSIVVPDVVAESLSY